MDASSSRGRKRERPEDTSVASYFGYHNENNPFNDSNLSSSFTWKLKRKKLLKEGVDPNALSEEQEMKRREELKVRSLSSVIPPPFSFLLLPSHSSSPLLILSSPPVTFLFLPLPLFSSPLSLLLLLYLGVILT